VHGVGAAEVLGGDVRQPEVADEPVGDEVRDGADGDRTIAP
jgi:hypothetical protein